MIHLSPEETLLLLGSRPLLDEAMGERFATVAAGPIDWAYVLWRAETYQTVPLLKAHLEAAGADRAMPDFVSAYMANWSALSAARTIAQFRELGALIQAFDEAGIDHYLMKGAAIAALAYPDPLTRPMQDLDIMIQPGDAWRAQKLVYRLGYRHGVFWPRTGRFHHMFRRITPRALRFKHALHSVTKVVPMESPVAPDMVSPEWRRRQIKCAFADDGTLLMPVFIDIHVNLSAGMELEDVWRGAEARELLGRRVKVQSLTTMLWFSAVRLYREAFEHNTLKLQMLGDIDALLWLYPKEIDWPELLVMADKYRFGPALFYVLSQARELNGAPVPEAVLALLMPDPRKPPADADWGDVVPKLLSKPWINRVALA